MADRATLLRQLPQVDQLLHEGAFPALQEEHGRTRVVAALRSEIGAVRASLVEGDGELPTTADDWSERTRLRIERDRKTYYHPVLNATGVILHTGLGRASLPAEAAEAVRSLAVAPQRLEIDPDTGRRGGRDEGCSRRLRELLACEAATVVNNNAAATLVALAAMCEGRKVVLSRGELVEIGGSYRVPEIIAQSGAELCEVGTTNRTHLTDYASALEQEAVGALLKVHTSNYRVLGFTSSVDIAALAALAREHGVPLLHDLGSGCLVDPWRGEEEGPAAWFEEQSARHSLAAGSDLVCFSGDKLLGGPQAGILAGSAAAVERCRRHPLFRAMRPGRMVYTALEATLELYLSGPERAVEAIPALKQLAEPAAKVRERAERLAAAIDGLASLEATVVETTASAGSGALPLVEVPSFGIRLEVAGSSAEESARRLRTGTPSLLARIRDDALRLDARTLTDGELETVVAALSRLGAPAP